MPLNKSIDLEEEIKEEFDDDDEEVSHDRKINFISTLKQKLNSLENSNLQIKPKFSKSSSNLDKITVND